MMQTVIRTASQRSVAAGLVFARPTKASVRLSPLWRSLSRGDRQLVLAMVRKFRHASYGTIVDSYLQGATRRVMLVSLGDAHDWSIHRLLPLVRKLTQHVKTVKLSGLALFLDEWAVRGTTSADGAGLLAENVRLANYRYVQSGERAKPAGDAALALLELAVRKPDRALQDRLRRAEVVSDALDSCRTLANTPGGDMTPALLAKNIQSLGATYGIVTKVLGKRELERLGMGGILGVARGSAEEPRFIIMEYRGRSAAKPLVLIGKGVTFDSGGLNVKPGEHMADMHLDMSGAAAVAMATVASARLRLPLRVVGLIPAAENMPSGSGYRPGDILRSLSGKTIEIVNTDAEGRVILADALTYAERYKPDLVVDVATLTGSAQVALGSWIMGVQTPREAFHPALQAIGEASGDFAWPMPLWEEYEEQIKGTFGDWLNSSRKRGEAGMITAAAFLHQFAKAYPWVHLDIASTMVAAEGHYLARGATGTGLRFLVELLHRVADGRFRPEGKSA